MGDIPGGCASATATAACFARCGPIASSTESHGAVGVRIHGTAMCPGPQSCPHLCHGPTWIRDGWCEELARGEDATSAVQAITPQLRKRRRETVVD